MWVGIPQAIGTLFRLPTRLRGGNLHSVLVGIDGKAASEMCYSTFLDRLLSKPTYLSRSVDYCAEDRNSVSNEPLGCTSSAPIFAFTGNLLCHSTATPPLVSMPNNCGQSGEVKIARSGRNHPTESNSGSRMQW
jgi:hypothetical protein